MSSGDAGEAPAVADDSSPTASPTTTTASTSLDIVINRVPDQGDIISLPALGVAGTIQRAGRCITLARADKQHGLIVPEVTQVDVVGGAVVLSGPDGRSFSEGDLVFFGGVKGYSGYVQMSEEAGLLHSDDCPGPYAAWPYWSESCAIESYDDILDC